MSHGQVTPVIDLDDSDKLKEMYGHIYEDEPWSKEVPEEGDQHLRHIALDPLGQH